MKWLAWPVGVVAALVVVTAYAQGNPIVTAPPSSSSTSTHIDVTVQAPPEDPKAIAEAATQSSDAVIVNVLAPIPVGFVKGAIGSFPNVWTQTPPNLTYANGDLSRLAGVVRDGSLALSGLAVFALGMKLAFTRTAPTGRLLFGVVMCLGNLVWWKVGIDLNNAINQQISAPTLASLLNPGMTLPKVADGTIPTPDIVASAVLAAVFAVVGFLTMFSLLARLALIDILIVVGPLALICFASEESASWGTMYARTAVGLTFSQVLITVAFLVAKVLGVLGTSGVLGAIVGIAVLLTIRGLPSLMASGRMTAGPSNSAAFGAILAFGRRALGLLI